MSEEQLIATPGTFGENGNFLLERELGRGGMGGVYMGRDKMLDRPVAVKVMLPEYGSDPAFVEKFKKEAQAVARLIHPNIAQVYSYGIASGMPYIAMELVAGGSLDGLMKAKGAEIEVPRVMKICEQVAQALRCAADQGLVHGDVKPENILLDANGNAKLVDFGLAAMQKDTTEIWGTPYYIAPEKVRKQPVDYRADMYSLGGTIYHALTGVAPFEGDDAVQVVRKRFEGMPRPPSELRAGLSPQIDALVMKMLALEPQDRYPSFEALLDDFKNVMTVGLGYTSKISATGMIPPGAAPAAGASATSGGKKLKLKPRTFKVRPHADAESGASAAEAPAQKKKYDDEEEEGGSVGLKVVGVVGGAIAAVGLVVGGLVWYQVADAKARERERQAEVSAGFNKAHDAFVKTRSAALNLADSFDDFAKEALSILRKPTDKMVAMLSERYPAGSYPAIDPGPTPELLAAIASTNAQAAAAAPAAAAKPAAARAVPAAKFRDPNEDEKDPMSPEGQKYLEEKKAWEAEQAAKAAAPAEPEQQAEEQSAAQNQEAQPGLSEEVKSSLNAMSELWGKAYGCIAASIEVRRQVTELVKDIDASIAVHTDDPEVVRQLGAKSQEFAERFAQIKESKLVIDAEKAKGFIKSRTTGDRSIVKKLEKQLTKEVKEEERKRAEAERIKRENDEKEARARARAERVEFETSLAKERFEAVVSSRKLTQLDWNGSLALMRQAESDITLPEGEIAFKKELRKIEAMKYAQDIFVRNLKGFKFAKSKDKDKAGVNLKGCTVEAVDAKEITVVKPNGQKLAPISWMKFYRDYHSNLNELINRFIRHGRQHDKNMSLKDWSNAMFGMALTMQIVCSDNPTAAAFGDTLVLEAAKGFQPDIPYFKEVFPDVDFTPAESESEE